MKILIADDDSVSRSILKITLEEWDYEILAAEDGQIAWEIFQSDEIRFVISDWMMPNMDGLELCRRIRAANKQNYTYIILLTCKSGKINFIEGMNAGADDFICKPFNREELKVRILAGQRILNIQQHITELRGIIPICMHCHKIRNDHEIWDQIEKYIEEHSDAHFSHSICPECMIKYYKK